jgi:hypothetical protein
MKKYFQHLVANWIVAGKCFRGMGMQFLLFLFHFIHGLIDCKYTSHEWWGIRLDAKGIATKLRKLGDEAKRLQIDFFSVVEVGDEYASRIFTYKPRHFKKVVLDRVNSDD